LRYYRFHSYLRTLGKPSEGRDREPESIPD
jgi:hypothetical protein